MKSKNNTISFIIVNYNSLSELKKCLTDLNKIKNATTFEVIIVNNDHKKLNLTIFSFQKQIIIEVNENIGFGTACNKGLAKSSGEYICFLNPDTHSFCHNLSDITNSLKTKDVIASPRILTSDGNIEPWSFGKNITLLQLLKNNTGLTAKTPTSKNIDWVSGAAMFSHRELLTKISGFDENFFLYFEDVDICKRATMIGYKIKLIRSLFLTHTNGSSSKNSAQKQKKCYYDSQELFFKKHLGPIQLLLLRICRIFHH